jgi:transposase InsO family protein
MARGFVYLAAVLDWFSRRALSWRVSIAMEASFCIAALEEALARQREAGDLQHGSGQPVHGCSLHRRAQQE